MVAKPSKEPDMSEDSIETLEHRAVEQRRQLDRSASDLYDKVVDARDQLRASRLARSHLGAMSAFAAMIGILSGYIFAGLFTRH
jgi:hypothetical protein